MAESKWNEVKEKLILVEAWARDGLIDEQIANNLGISPRTLYCYRNKYPQFLQALKRGKEAVDVEVENALLKRALGYKYTEVTRELNEAGQLVITKEVVKEVQPDTTAQIFWLKNRKRDVWRDKQEVDMNADVTYQVIPCSLLEPKEG